MQQPFNLPPHHPYDVALGPNGVRVGLAPPLNGTHGAQDLLHRVQVGRQPAAHEELLAIVGAPLLAEEGGLVKVGDGRRQRPRQRQVDVQVLREQVAGLEEGLQVALLDVVDGGLDGGGVGHRGVHAYGADRPQGGGAAGLEDAGGPRPEARHVEPVRRRGGGDEVDAGILDRRREVPPEIFGR